jgi:hypothetical protein
VTFQVPVTLNASAPFLATGPVTLAGTGVTINPSGAPGTVVIATTGSSTITLNSPVTAGTGILIGTTAPAGGSPGYVQIGTPTAPGVLVRANLDTVVVTTATSTTSACTNANHILLSGGCDCGTNQVSRISMSGITVTCSCSNAGTPTNTYAVCLQSP